MVDGQKSAVFMVLLAAACSTIAPQGGTGAQKTGGSNWRGYVAGDDLRAACVEDSPDRLRLVFNADYSGWVRAYDIEAGLEDGGARVRMRVYHATDLARVEHAPPAAGEGGAGEGGAGEGGAGEGGAEIRLDPADFAALVDLLDENGAFDPVSQPRRLATASVEWLICGCVGGQWFHNAFPYPTGRFAAFQRRGHRP